SRRRHTRSKRDWSSDVCSSDLYVAFVVPQVDAGWIVIFPDFPDVVAKGPSLHEALRRAQRELNDRADVFRILGAPMPPPQRVARSEERRVGKEGSSGGGQCRVR